MSKSPKRVLVTGAGTKLTEILTIPGFCPLFPPLADVVAGNIGYALLPRIAKYSLWITQQGNEWVVCVMLVGSLTPHPLANFFQWWDARSWPACDSSPPWDPTCWGSFEGYRPHHFAVAVGFREYSTESYQSSHLINYCFSLQPSFSITLNWSRTCHFFSNLHCWHELQVLFLNSKTALSPFWLVSWPPQTPTWPSRT